MKNKELIELLEDYKDINRAMIIVGVNKKEAIKKNEKLQKIINILKEDEKIVLELFSKKLYEKETRKLFGKDYISENNKEWVNMFDGKPAEYMRKEGFMCAESWVKVVEINKEFAYLLYDFAYNRLIKRK